MAHEENLILQKSGISKHFPQLVLFGPEKFHGLGLLHPFHFQELEHLEIALRCENWDSTTGSLVETSMEELKLELGLPGQVTDWNFNRPTKCATDCWLKLACGYCCQWGLELMDPTPSRPWSRDRDKHIMLALLQSTKNYTPCQL